MIEQARARFIRVIQQINQDENLSAYRQAWLIPLAFYHEFNDEECLALLRSGEAEARSKAILETYMNRCCIGGIGHTEQFGKIDIETAIGCALLAMDQRGIPPTTSHDVVYVMEQIMSGDLTEAENRWNRYFHEQYEG